MKKTIIGISALALSACSSVHIQPPLQITHPPLAKAPRPKVITPAPVPAPVPAPIPQVLVPALPEFLSAPVPTLPVLVDGTIKGIMRDGAQTDSMYNNLAARYKALRNVYECVRGAINSHDASKVCIK